MSRGQARPTATPRPTSSTSPSDSCRSVASTASATPTSPPSRRHHRQPPLPLRRQGRARPRAHRPLRRRFEEAPDRHRGRRRRRPAKLAAYAELYADVLRRPADVPLRHARRRYETLPEPMRAAVLRFFDANEDVARRRARGGRRDGTLAFDGQPREDARAIVGGLEGAMLLARPYGDVSRFEAVAKRLLRDAPPSAVPFATGGPSCPRRGSVPRGRAARLRSRRRSSRACAG